MKYDYCKLRYPVTRKQTVFQILSTIKKRKGRNEDKKMKEEREEERRKEERISSDVFYWLYTEIIIFGYIFGQGKCINKIKVTCFCLLF